MNDSMREQICAIGRRIYQNGFAAANDGNISVRCGDRVITTPTGVSKGFLQPDMLVEVNLEGGVLTGSLQPSSELKMHLEVYRQRSDARAVVHAHPPYATAFAIVGRVPDQPIIAEAVVTVGPVALAPYATPSTPGVARSIAPYLAAHDAILLSNHGALTYGADLETAYWRLESLEFYAKLTVLSSQIGAPRLLTPEQLGELQVLRSRTRTKQESTLSGAGGCTGTICG